MKEGSYMSKLNHITEMLELKDNNKIVIINKKSKKFIIKFMKNL